MNLLVFLIGSSMSDNEKINLIFFKFKIDKIDFNEKIYNIIDSLEVIKLSLEVEKQFNIKLKLSTDLTIKNIYEQIFK